MGGCLCSPVRPEGRVQSHEREMHYRIHKPIPANKSYEFKHHHKWTSYFYSWFLFADVKPAELDALFQIHSELCTLQFSPFHCCEQWFTAILCILSLLTSTSLLVGGLHLTNSRTKLTVTQRRGGVINSLVYSSFPKTTELETMLIMHWMPVEPGLGSPVICTLITQNVLLPKAVTTSEGLLTCKPC